MNDPNDYPDREQFLQRPLPSSPDAERAILGAVLLDNDLFPQAVEELEPSDFYSPNNRRIFKAMSALFERGDRIDPILIGEELKKEASLDSIGGVATITNLTYGLPHFTDLSDYVKTVSDKAFVRRISRTGTEIQNFALDDAETPETIANYAEQRIFDVCNQPTQAKPEKIGTLAFASVQKTAELVRSGVKVAGVPSGLADLDRKTGGFKPTDLIIVAARPSHGKTALCLTIAQNAALDKKSVILIFSLEMSKEALTARLLCSRAKVDLHRYLNLYITRDEWGRLAEAADFFEGLNIIIDDTPAITTMEMLAKARRVYAEHKRLDLIVADYLQLMKASRRTESETAEVSQVSKDLKAIAKQLDVPVIAISSLSRSPETRNPPRPMMSDLRQSGQIEFDADVVIFIYREEMYQRTEENAGVAELIIAKQRNGPTGTVKLAFLSEFTTFENYFGEDFSRESDRNNRQQLPLVAPPPDDEPQEDRRYR